jgi:hypothetical protein
MTASVGASGDWTKERNEQDDDRRDLCLCFSEAPGRTSERDQGSDREPDGQHRDG